MRDRNVPKLRFKEFSDEWELSNLNKLCDINPKSKELPKKFKYIDLESIVDGILVKDKELTIEEAPSRAQRLLSEGDVLFQTVRPYQMNNYIFKQNNSIPSVASTGYAQLRSKNGISNNEFIYQIIHNKNFNNNVMLRCTGTSYPAINSSELAIIPLMVPGLEEQEKIASFFNKVDKIIEKQEEKVSNLEKYKKGMMQKIFSQEIRFKNNEGGEYPEWEFKKLNSVLTERREKNYGELRVCSVAVRKGVIDQIEHLGRSFAAKDTSNYKLVKYGDIIYTKSPTGDFPYGIVKQSFLNEDVVVSPLYGVFTPSNFAIGHILHNYFNYRENTNTYLHSIIQKGAKNTINISNDTFISKGIMLPVSVDEQKKISGFLYKIDSVVEKEKEKLEELRVWKKGLLQQMFV